MVIAGISLILFLILVYKVNLFNLDGDIEKNMMPANAEFSIAAMPFRVERIVYYVTAPNPTFGMDDLLINRLTVEYVKKKAFDSYPIAIQVYYARDRERKMVAEILSHRFDVPYLDSLYGENLLTRKEYEYLRLYKYNHPSTADLLREEVACKLRPQHKLKLAPSEKQQ